MTNEEIYYAVIIFLILFIPVLIFRLVFARKCNSCKKYRAMKETNKELIEEKPTTIIKELKERDGEGKIIKTKEIAIPGTKYIYRHHQECKFCGYTTSFLKTITKAD